MTLYSGNGWVASPDPEQIGITALVVNGNNFSPGIRGGDVHAVLGWVAQQVNDRVEKLTIGGGYSFRANVNDPSSLSNHASGTAIDYNYPQHPNADPTVNNWTAVQIDEIHAILGECEGVVRWGGDYHSTPDAMHFEINAGPVDVARVARKLGASTEPSANVPGPDQDGAPTGVENWDFEDNISYGPWEVMDTITQVQGYDDTMPYGSQNPMPAFRESNGTRQASYTTDFTPYGAVDDSGGFWQGTGSVQDYGMRQAKAQEAWDAVSDPEGLHQRIVTDNYTEPAVNGIYVSQCDVHGSDGWPFNFNAPYSYQFTAGNVTQGGWVAPEVKLPYPQNWPSNAIGWQYESDEWTLVKATLGYSFLTMASADLHANMAGTVDFRYSVNPTVIEAMAAGTLPTPSAFEHDLASVHLSTFSEPRYTDEYGYDRVNTDWVHVTNRDPGGTLIDITDQLPRTAAISLWDGYSWSLHNQAFAVGFEAHVMGVNFTVSTDSTTQRAGGGAIGIWMLGTNGWVDRDGVAQQLTASPTVTYILRPPRRRWVFQNQGPGDGADALPVRPGTLSAIYGCTYYDTAERGARFFKWSPNHGVTYASPPAGRAVAPFTRLPDGRLVCYDAGFIQDSGRMSIGYIMDANFNLLEELGSYRVRDYQVSQYEWLSPMYREGAVFYRPETNKVWLAQFLYHQLRYDYPHPGDTNGGSVQVSYGLQEMSISGIDLHHHAIGERGSGSDVYNDQDTLCYAGGCFWFTNYGYKTLIRFDPKTGIKSLAGIGFDADRVMGMDLNGRLILLVTYGSWTWNGTTWVFNGGADLRAINLDDLTWHEATYNNYPFPQSPPVVPTTNYSITDMPEYSGDPQAFGMIGNTVYYGTTRFPDSSDEKGWTGIVAYDLDAQQWSEVMRMPVWADAAQTIWGGDAQNLILINGMAALSADFEFTIDDSGWVVTFDGSKSDGDIVTYTWDFDDELDTLQGDGKTTAHFYQVAPTTYQVTLTVQDASGQTASVTKPVELTGGKIIGGPLDGDRAFTHVNS